MPWCKAPDKIWHYLVKRGKEIKVFCGKEDNNFSWIDGPTKSPHLCASEKHCQTCLDEFNRGFEKRELSVDVKEGKIGINHIAHVTDTNNCQAFIITTRAKRASVDAHWVDSNGFGVVLGADNYTLHTEPSDEDTQVTISIKPKLKGEWKFSSSAGRYSIFLVLFRLNKDEEVWESSK